MNNNIRNRISNRRPGRLLLIRENHFHFISPRLRDLGGLGQLQLAYEHDIKHIFYYVLEILIFLVSLGRLVFVSRINYYIVLTKKGKAYVRKYAFGRHKFDFNKTNWFFVVLFQKYECMRLVCVCVRECVRLSIYV